MVLKLTIVCSRGIYYDLYIAVVPHSGRQCWYYYGPKFSADMEFWTEPQNFPVSEEYRGILQKSTGRW